MKNKIYSKEEFAKMQEIAEQNIYYESCCKTCKDRLVKEGEYYHICFALYHNCASYFCELVKLWKKKH